MARPATPPQKLTVAGVEAAAMLCAEADKARAEGSPFAPKEDAFKSGIYGHETVRGALYAAQHGKCAFCEARLPGAKGAEVEHFRPKGAWQQARGEKASRPGYYWLAYAWANLLLSCHDCNSTLHKGNLFPLETGSTRATDHRADLTAERPSFIDPSAEEPADHVRFRQHTPYAVRGGSRGERTIDGFGLRRGPLRDQRRTTYDRLDALLTIARAHPDPSLRTRAKAALLRSAEAPAPFSAMARDFLVAKEFLAR